MFKATPQKISSLSPSEEDVELIRHVWYAGFHRKQYQTRSDTELSLDYIIGKSLIEAFQELYERPKNLIWHDAVSHNLVLYDGDRRDNHVPLSSVL